MKTILTLDVETTHMEKKNGGHTPLPYFGNRLVSVGYKYMDSPTNYLCFYHSDREPDYKGNEILQDALDNAEVLVGHNIKLTFVGSENVALSTMATCMTLWLLSIFLHDQGDGD